MRRSDVLYTLSTVVATAMLALIAPPADAVRHPGGHVWFWSWAIVAGLIMLAGNLTVMAGRTAANGLVARTVALLMSVADLAVVVALLRVRV